MSKFIISLGSIDKKLILPLLHIILYSFINIYKNFLDSTNHVKYHTAVLYAQYFGRSISGVMIYFFANLFRYKSHDTKKKNIEKQHYLKDFSILFIFFAFWMIFEIYYYMFLETFYNLNINLLIELIFITLATYFLLKYKYYKHHIISIIIFIILCIIKDLILDYFKNIKASSMIFSIIYDLSQSLYFSYMKYLIEYKYYFFINLWFIFGIFYFTINFISLAIITIRNISNGSYDIFYRFYDFCNEKGVLYMIFRFFLDLLFMDFYMIFSYF